MPPTRAEKGSHCPPRGSPVRAKRRSSSGKVDQQNLTVAVARPCDDDFALVAVGPDGPDAPANAPGLFHVAFKVGTSLDELRAVKAELEAAGVTVDNVFDHTVSQSLYLKDPDGNSVELYVDGSDVWKTDPQAVATIVPLTL